MNIQQNTNINFKATKLLTVHKELKNKAPDFIDIIRLNRTEDDKFIRTCCSVINQNKSKATLEIKKLKAFFEQFLSDSILDSNQYIIAVKNGEQITGGCAFYSLINKIVLNKTFCTDKKSQIVKDSLLYTLLAHAKNKKDVITGVDLPKLTGKKGYIIQANNINSSQKQITKQYPNTTFTTTEEKVNLSELFDYNEFKPELI